MKRARNSMFERRSRLSDSRHDGELPQNGIPGKRSDDEEVVVGRNPLLETIAWLLYVPARD